MQQRSILHGLRSKIYRGKTREISQAWIPTFLNLRHNSEHVNAVISGTGQPHENRIFRFLNIHKNIVFYLNWKKFSQKFIAWNIESDGKIKILMIWALLGNSSEIKVTDEFFSNIPWMFSTKHYFEKHKNDRTPCSLKRFDGPILPNLCLYSC